MNNRSHNWAEVMLKTNLLLLLIPSVAFAQVPTNQNQLFQFNRDIFFTSGQLSLPWLASPVDYDNDGTLDIIVFGHHTSDAYVLLNAQEPAYYLDSTQWVLGKRDPFWFDYEEDGDIDGLGTEGYQIAGQLYLNDGVGNYVSGAENFDVPVNDFEIIDAITLPAEITSLGGHPLNATWKENYYVDLNNDGIDERIITLHGNKTDGTSGRWHYSWVLGYENGVWTDITESIGLTQEPQVLLFPEDIDNDGDLDLINLRGSKLYQNNAGYFTVVNDSVFSDNDYNGDGQKWIIDLDNNGYRDFIFAYNHYTQHGIYLNNGDNTFTKLTGSIVIGDMTRNRYADLDGDGDYDLISYNGYGKVSIWDNVTANKGVFLPYTGPVFGQKAIVTKNGFLAHYEQVIMQSNMSTANVADRLIHVGNIQLGDIIELTMNGTVPDPEPDPDYDAVALEAGLQAIEAGISDVNNSLNISIPEIESELINIQLSVDVIIRATQ